MTSSHWYVVLIRIRSGHKPISDKLCMVASTVSSKMIEAMAAVEGFKFVECLTGYSFDISRVRD